MDALSAIVFFLALVVWLMRHDIAYEFENWRIRKHLKKLRGKRHDAY